MHTESRGDGNVAILVLGMHRSGTSAATRVLNLLGAHLGSDLLAPQADNQRGFWEHSRAVEIHEHLLAGLGRNWHDIREMPAGWLDHPSSARALSEIAQLTATDFAGQPLWAIKDPRMCRLVALWRGSLERSGVRPAVLMVVRDPREVAQSLYVRDGWSHARSYTMWAQHFLESYRDTQGVPRAILNYDDLLSDWRGAMARVTEALGVQWPRSSDDVEAEVTAFLDPGDRHHRAGQSLSEGTHHQPPAALMELFRRACDVASGKADWSVLEEIDKQYLESSSIFSMAFEELVLERNEVERVAVERMDHINGLVHAKSLVEGRCEELSVAVARTSSEAARISSEAARISSEAVRTSTEAIRLSEENARLSGEGARLLNEVSRLADENMQLRLTQKTLSDDLAHQRAEIASTEMRIAQVTEKVRSRRWLLRQLLRRMSGR